jgi:predicted acetyltransferase
MLAAALPIARSLGITRALLTCDETNTASQRVIETNGGQFIDRGLMERGELRCRRKRSGNNTEGC